MFERPVKGKMWRRKRAQQRARKCSEGSKWTVLKSSSWTSRVAGVEGLVEREVVEMEALEVELREEEAAVMKLELEGRQVW